MVNRLAHCLCTIDDSTSNIWLNNNIYLRKPTDSLNDTIKSTQQAKDFITFTNNDIYNESIVKLALILVSNYPEYESILGLDWNDKSYDFKTNNFIFPNPDGHNICPTEYIQNYINYCKDKPEVLHRILTRAGLLKSWLSVAYDKNKLFEQFIVLIIAIAKNNIVYYFYDI